MNRNRPWWVLFVAGLAAIATSILLWNAPYQYIPVYSTDRPTPPGHNVHSVAFSPDGKTLATSGYDAKRDGEVRLWDVAARRSTTTVTSRPGHWVNSAVFSPDGTTLAIAGDQDVRLWDVTGRRYLAVVNTGDEAVSTVDAVAFSPDGRTVATGGYGIGLWREAGDD